MSKQKQFVRPPKKQKPRNADPKTIDDFQEAADFHEDSGGKHRKGDPVKSARAFLRALDVYDQGLAKHPTSFDLSYNKARLQLEISENPSLVEHIGYSLDEWLQITLDSHQHALQLDNNNPDLMFNTAQVLSSLAELLEEASFTGKSVALWQQSLEMLASCLSRQEVLFEQHQADFPDEEDGGVSLSAHDGLVAISTTPNTEISEQEEQTATIEVPVSASDLLDTVHASLSALISLTSVVGNAESTTLHSEVDHLMAKASEYISRMPAEEQLAARVNTAGLRGTFVASDADARFQAGTIDIDTYVKRLDIFQIPNRDTSVIVLGSESEARREFVRSVLTGHDASLHGLACWRQASLAQDALSKALTINDEEAQSRKAEIYLAKGDIELLRHRLIHWHVPSMAASLPESVRTSAPMLMANAKKFYNGSALHADRDGDEGGAIEAKQKFAIASGVAAYFHGEPWPDASVRESIMAQGPHCMDDSLLDESLLLAISATQPRASRS